MILLSAGLCRVLAILDLIVSPPLYEATAQLLVLRQGKNMPAITGSVDVMQAMGGGGMRFGGMGGGPRFAGVGGPRFAGTRFAGAPFSHAAFSPRFSRVAFRDGFHHRFFHHRFHRFAFVGAPFLYADYGYDSCYRRVWTAYGVQWVDVCGSYAYGY